MLTGGSSQVDDPLSIEALTSADNVLGQAVSWSNYAAEAILSHCLLPCVNGLLAHALGRITHKEQAAEVQLKLHFLYGIEAGKALDDQPIGKVWGDCTVGAVLGHGLQPQHRIAKESKR